MARKMIGLNVSLSDEPSALMLKTIIDYESIRRGLTRGQTIALLVEEAADIENYPKEVRDRLDEIEERMRKAAVEECLGVSGGCGRVA